MTNHNQQKNTQGDHDNDRDTRKHGGGQTDPQKPGQGGQKPSDEPGKQAPSKGSDKR